MHQVHDHTSQHTPERPRRTSIAASIRTASHRRGDEPVDALGIPWRVHYAVIAISSFNLSFVPLVLSLTESGAELRHPIVVAMCFSGLLSMPLYIGLGKRWGWHYNAVFFNVVMVQSTASLVFASNFLDELRGPMMASLLLGATGAAYYLRPRQARWHLALAAAAIMSFAPRFENSNEFLRCLFLAILVVAAGTMVIFLRRQLERVVASNRELSRRDALTGAANLRHFEERLRHAIEHHDQGGEPFAIAALDLDDFKQVNDRFSHTLGDEVLIAVAQTAQRLLGERDLLVRRGGDEFMILFADAADRDVEGELERIRYATARARADICAGVIPTVTSAFVTHRRAETAAELVRRADDELHVVKADSPSTRRGTTGAELVQDVIEGALARVPRSWDERLHGAGGADAELQSGSGEHTAEDPVHGANRIAWRTAAGTTASFSLAVLAIGYAEITDLRLNALLVAINMLALVVLAPSFWLISTTSHEWRWAPHMLASSTLALITAGGLTVGEVSVAGADMILMVVIVIWSILPWRASLAYTVVAVAIYMGFMIGHAVPMSGIRGANAFTNVMVVAVVLGMTRVLTIQAAARNAELASVDALTRLPNLRRLRERLEYEVRRCGTSGGTFSLIMLDLDDFKSVNDLYSHSLGDRVLVAVAEALRESARHSEMPARRGGDEFAVVLADAGIDVARAVAGRIGAEIETARLRECPPLAPTASIGFVEWRTGESVDSLLGRVDAALHERKVESHAARGLLEAAA